MIDPYILASAELNEIIMSALGELAAQGKIPSCALPAFRIERPQEKGYGDFACNAALSCAKEVGMLPRELAQLISDALYLGGSSFSCAKVNGPRYINFTLSQNWCSGVLRTIISECEGFGYSELSDRTVFTSEFSETDKLEAARRKLTDIISTYENDGCTLQELSLSTLNSLDSDEEITLIKTAATLPDILCGAELSSDATAIVSYLGQFSDRLCVYLEAYGNDECNVNKRNAHLYFLCAMKQVLENAAWAIGI